jgi:hypothetical protein
VGGKTATQRKRRMGKKRKRKKIKNMDSMSVKIMGNNFCPKLITGSLLKAIKYQNIG